MKHLERFARGLLIGLAVVLALGTFALLIQAAIHYPGTTVVAVFCIVAYIVGMALEKAEE